jgi:aryl-alcohol dehydrogenase-like predicted oxidoreductase
MRYRRFGGTGITVSEVGVGGGGLGHLWGATTPEEVQEAIDYALTEGINFFDVAPAYGRGLAERNLGEGLRGRRERAIVATKVFLTEDELSDDIGSAVERSLSASLERLETDYVDLFQLHNWVTQERGDVRWSVSLADVLGPGGVVEALQRLRGGGSVRFVGFTGMGDADAVREVMRDGGLDSVQVYYNLLNPSAAWPLGGRTTLWDHGQILPLAEELGMAAIGIRNQAGGALSGGIDREVPTDSLFARDLARAERLSFLAEGGQRISQLATRFVLDHPAITTVVPGVKNRAEVADSIAGAELPALAREAVDRLRELAAEDFGVAEPLGAPM